MSFPGLALAWHQRLLTLQQMTHCPIPGCFCKERELLAATRPARENLCQSRESSALGLMQEATHTFATAPEVLTLRFQHPGGKKQLILAAMFPSNFELKSAMVFVPTLIPYRKLFQ